MKKLFAQLKNIVCPNCKKVVSDKVGKCPNCSYMFGKNQPLATSEDLKKANNQ